MLSSRKFYDLPPELLTAIAEECTWGNADHHTSLGYLKALRLSHSHFAYLDYILQWMFCTLRFDADAYHIEQLAETNLRFIAPFVTGVNLVTPLHSWTCTLQNFKSIVHSQDPELCESFEEADFRDGYKYYRNKALANQEYLRNQKSSFTRATWTNAFRLLNNMHSIRFLDFPNTRPSLIKHLPDPLRCTIQPPWYYMSDVVRRMNAAPLGDALFELGMDSLTESDVCVETLGISCPMTGLFGWENFTNWEKFDLSSLRDFEFDPLATSFPSYGADGGLPKGEIAIAARASDAISSVMKKCKDSLEIFKYGSYCPKIWPGDQVIPLPNLKELSIENGYLEPKNAHRWLANMPSLDKLKFQFIGISSRPWRPRPYRDWLHVFDAIRNHPGALQVWLWDIVVNPSEPESISHCTTDFEKYLQKDSSGVWQEKLQRSLALYLSGAIEVDDNIGFMFEKEYTQISWGSHH